MKWTRKGWAILAAGLALAVNVRASIEDPESKERSYQVIVDRNPFNLKPLPLAGPPPGPTNPPAKTNLKLTGFTNIGAKRAFFVLIDEKTKTNQPISLAIDQEVDGLKVLEIDPVFRKVRVLKDGVEKLMAFDTDGLTNAVAIAAPAGVPGIPGIGAGAGINRPGSPPPPTVTPGTVTPGAVSPNANAPGFRSIPSRNLRTSTETGAQPTYAGAAASLGGDASRFMPIPSGSSTPPAPTPQPDRDAAQQMILLEAQRALNPNLPPTPGLPPPLPGASR